MTLAYFPGRQISRDEAKKDSGQYKDEGGQWCAGRVHLCCWPREQAPSPGCSSTQSQAGAAARRLWGRLPAGRDRLLLQGEHSWLREKGRLQLSRKD
jgi:hypothetical protein